MNKLGFGFLRFLPTIPDDVKSFDRKQLCDMVDYFIEHGGRYFDTGYNYLDGESEIAIRENVVKRYPRNNIEIADKLPTWLIKTKDDCARYFREQQV